MLFKPLTNAPIQPNILGLWTLINAPVGGMNEGVCKSKVFEKLNYLAWGLSELAHSAQNINMPLLEGPQELCRLLTPPCKGDLVPKRDNLGVELCGVRSLTTRGGAALLLGDRLGASAFRLLDSQTKTRREKSLLTWLELDCMQRHLRYPYTVHRIDYRRAVYSSLNRLNPYGCTTHICCSKALSQAV